MPTRAPRSNPDDALEMGPSARLLAAFYREVPSNDSLIPTVDEDLVELLRGRDAIDTVVELEDGQRLRVRNIAWGYDSGDHSAHITTNCSPFVPGYDVDLFFTNEILSVEDDLSEEVVWRRGL